MLDVFTRVWVGYAFATYATRDVAIQSVTESVASSDGPLDGLALQTDNGPQYTGDEFKGSMKALEIEHRLIWRNTPQQNGHIESFHRTLKKEYLWPHEFESFREAEVVVGKAFTDYNNRRPLVAGIQHAADVRIQMEGEK